MTLPDQFRAFAESSARDGAITYGAICRGAADDPELLDLVARAPVTQRRPNLLLAAVHFLLLGGTPHALATHYDTVAAYLGTDPVGARRPPPTRLQGLLPDPPRRTAGAHRHRQHADQRGRSLHARCCPPSATSPPATTVASLWACSTWAPRPASTCSSTTMPIPTAVAMAVAMARRSP